LFAVYLVGAAVTPWSGRWIDGYGHRAAVAAAIGIGVTGSILTLMAPLALIVTGLALTATGVFIAQATASSYVGAMAERDRGLAVGLYGTFYYTGGAAGSSLPAFLWAFGGWPACVALVVSVQIATVALAWSFWSKSELRGAGAAFD
jgi:MFS family permease